MKNGSPDLHALVGGYVADQCSVILAAAPLLAEGAHVVHDTRVAVRRLRSTLRVFAEVFDIARAGELEDELVWWAGLLGTVRDLDVLGLRIDAAVAALPPEVVLGPVRSHLQTEISVRRRVAAALVAEQVETDRYRRLLDSLEAWRTRPPFATGPDTGPAKVSHYVKRAGNKLRTRLKAAVVAEKSGAAEADDLLHRARKAGKRHRYAVELAEPGLGSKAAKVIAARKDLQDVLGDHQDSVVGAAFLRTVGAEVGTKDGHNGFTYGLLHARELDSRRGLARRLEPFVK